MARRVRIGRRSGARAAVAGLAIGLVASAWAARALDWPQEVEAPEGTIVVYQPQPESLTGNVLTARAAMSLELKDRSEPIFGAFWFTAKIDTNTDTDTALVHDVVVTRVRWPDSKDPAEQRFTQIVESAIPEAGFTISLDRLSASLATAQREERSLENLKNDPPKIVFRDRLAVLLIFDGTPRFSPVEDSPYERALNTPFLVVRDTRSKTLYLSSGSLWYEAADPLGPWSPTSAPPADLAKMLPAADDGASAPKTPPEIVVATEPTELVCSDGKPSWTSLTGGQILYVENTETPWLRDLAAGNMYVLLSGRWYRAKGESGPWTFVRADQLPDSFRQIPPASDIGGLRVSVAGTEEADEALLDAEIPQTAAIRRSEAKLEVEYDGEPKFEAIPGTRVSYAVNTGVQVLEIDGCYYAVDNGVWFTSKAAGGPWAVADEIPEDEIGKIPPSSPVYNTTYVTIYDSTPEVVYVGYRPGYLWSFPYYGVPVYGTGWYYPPYWGSFYYPRPPTWGFHFGYNPWTGWNYRVSWSNGFFSFGMSWGGGYGYYRPWGCCGGWYGGGYRGPVYINTGDINIGNTINVGNRTDIANKLGDRKTNIGRLGSRNAYDRPEVRSRIADRATAKANLKQARGAPGRKNDVFADERGAVARREGDQWQVRDRGQWTRDAVPEKVPEGASDRAAAVRDRTTPEQRSQAADRARERVKPSPPVQQRPTQTTRPSPSQIDRRDLDRADRARQIGSRREMARPQRPVQRPSGGLRGR